MTAMANDSNPEWPAEVGATVTRLIADFRDCHKLLERLGRPHEMHDIVRVCLNLATSSNATAQPEQSGSASEEPEAQVRLHSCPPPCA